LQAGSIGAGERKIDPACRGRRDGGDLPISRLFRANRPMSPLRPAAAFMDSSLPEDSRAAARRDFTRAFWCPGRSETSS